MNTLHLKRNLVTIVSIIIGAIGISVSLATAITIAWYAFNYIEDFSTQILFGAVSVYFCYRGYLITRCVLNKLIIMIFSLHHYVAVYVMDTGEEYQVTLFHKYWPAAFVEAKGICEKDEKLKGIYINLKAVNRLYKVS
ncbi:MAG: hypothetical protein SPL83_10990 [Succinivibrio sp.]|nr:hypothetical protein [Succinivibrio sp.]MDY6262209.1 hypothetical protein [Succinivibrio sp.]